MDEDTDREDIAGRIGEDLDTTASLLGHYYRAELDRMNTEQSRIDLTTNWAITLMAAILAFVFSSGDRPHYVLLVGILTLAVLHFVETRRYRAYDTWRSRVRLIEEDLIAPVLDSKLSVDHTDWRRELARDLQSPALKTTFIEAYARRLRRVYLPLFLVLLAAWAVEVLVITPRGGPLEAAAVPGLPGWVVVAAVVGFLLVVLSVAFWPRQRQAKGELTERGTTGDWKDE